MSNAEIAWLIVGYGIGMFFGGFLALGTERSRGRRAIQALQRHHLEELARVAEWEREGSSDE